MSNFLINLFPAQDMLLPSLLRSRWDFLLLGLNRMLRRIDMLLPSPLPCVLHLSCNQNCCGNLRHFVVPEDAVRKGEDTDSYRYEWNNLRGQTDIVGLIQFLIIVIQLLYYPRDGSLEFLKESFGFLVTEGDKIIFTTIQRKTRV